ncbi:hypothetical protein OVA10_15705 [Lelliottia sp. SL45]|uniref:hypothetical protein n=1 Tax=Lelliottia sp. SL45 TaxID=2994665 RepID=UPI0022766FD0|nr:hypothetical protein [Lelliottia sp. SL45]MCY1699492.1 hypothetical protein [Lelliottia sp. SL45]
MTEKEQALIAQIELQNQMVAELRAQNNAQAMLLTAIYQVFPDDYKNAINDVLVTAFSSPAPTATLSIRADIQEHLFLMCTGLKEKLLNS